MAAHVANNEETHPALDDTADKRVALFSELETFLRSLRTERFVFVPDPGNAGDSFIAHATYQLFDRLGLNYEIGFETATYPGRIAIWGGGGNLVPLYNNLNNFLLANMNVCKRLIILPHTIFGHENTLSRLGHNCQIFCRDRMSYQFTKHYAANAQIYLSHDIAFSANLKQTYREASHFPIPFLSDTPFARRNIKRMLYGIKYKAQSIRSPKTLNCFRGDLEKTDIQIPSPNIDVSAVYATGVMTKRDSLEVTYRMTRFIDRFDTVNTNRLHIAILSAILGKKVNFYSNSYGKNRAVFEHSMARYFRDVHWRE